MKGGLPNYRLAERLSQVSRVGMGGCRPPQPALFGDGTQRFLETIYRRTTIVGEVLYGANLSAATNISIG